jgi:purine-cytosine permease-like protein
MVWAILGVGVLTNAATALNNSLLIMLYLLAPWTAVNPTDFFFVRHGHYAITEIFTPGGLYRNWAWRGLLCYGLGFAVEIPFMALTFYAGPVAHAMQGVDISFLVGLAVSAVTYLLVSRRLDLRAESAAVRRSEEELAVS